MPKKIKNCFHKNLTFEKLIEAHKRARNHKAYKSEVINFEMNLENNITNLLNNIKNKKYHLKIPYYVRYMDDFVILAKNKNECKKLKEQIEHFLNTYLHLELNEKSRYYPNKMGVNFCGYRIFATHRLLRLNSKKKIKKNVKKWNYLYSKNKLDLYNTMQSLNSWLGHSSHCNSYKLQNKILNSCNFLYNSKAISKAEQELIYLIEKEKIVD